MAFATLIVCCFGLLVGMGFGEEDNTESVIPMVEEVELDDSSTDPQQTEPADAVDADEREGALSLKSICGRRVRSKNTIAVTPLDELFATTDEQGFEDIFAGEDFSDTDNTGFLDDQEKPLKPQAPRIVGGEISTAEQWPWQVSFRYRGMHFCGGSLIDSRHVVSAAHCFQQIRSGVEVYLGKSSKNLREPGEVKRMVVKIFTHARYKKPIENNNDISLIRLNKPVKFSATIRPICLPRPGAKIDENSNCFVSGFGSTHGTGGDLNLKSAKINVIPDEKCLSLSEQFAQALTENMICAGVLAGGIDSCQGDSGGPFVCQARKRPLTFELRGAVSFDKNSPGIYTKVANYLSWIRVAIRRR